MDKLAEIRSCFPSGEDCPGLVIVAHTKKPRSEDVRRGPLAGLPGQRERGPAQYMPLRLPAAALE